MTWKKLEKWMYAKDYRTWIAHGIHGVWIVALYDLSGMGTVGGIVATVLVFAFREFEGIVRHFVDYRATRLLSHRAVMLSHRKLLIDGVMDFVGPLIGNGFYLLLA